MIYFWKKEYKTDLNTKDVERQLMSKFEVTEQKEGVKLRRDRMIPNRGMIRMLVAGITVKALVSNGVCSCKMRLDGLATFMLVVFIGASVVELTLDPDTHQKDYPSWAPLAILVWYVFTVVVEVVFVKKALSSIFDKPIKN